MKRKKTIAPALPTTERPKHSPIGASSRARWSRCPGSVSLSKDEPNKSSIAAKEGTTAHELVATILDKSFSQKDDVAVTLLKFVDHILVYLNYVASLKKACGHVHIEHSFDMSNIFPDLYGTADAVAFDPVTKTVHVVDYKHGEGLVVEVENNLQLEYYALGALSTLKYNAHWVQMTIVQPRAYHPNGPIRHWRVPSLHFLDVEDNIISEAKDTLQKDALLLAGPHCMFCPAKTKCPQKAHANLGQAKKDFNFYTDPKKEFAPV